MTQDLNQNTFIEPPQSSWCKDIWGRELTREIDDLTSRHFHIHALALMESAGRSVAKLAIERGAEKHPVLILCGFGNNGGDGLVAARYLHEHGCNIHIVLVGRADPKRSPLFDQQLKTIESLNIKTSIWRPGSLTSLSIHRPIIVDSVTGLGFKPPCDGYLLQALSEAATIKDSTVIAVDVPSGIATDDGTIESAPLRAHETITFGASRPIHRLMPSATLCGAINIVDIGFPKAALNAALKSTPAIWREVDPTSIAQFNPWSGLPKTAHKYTRGHVLVIGGSKGKIGAPILAALSALRSGAGWCSIAVPISEITVDTPIPPELTKESFFDGETIKIPEFKEFLEQRHVHCVVVGPGWMKQCLNNESLSVLKDFTERGGRVVIDAGALHGLSHLIHSTGPLVKEHVIATPHPGEWKQIQDHPAAPPLTPFGVRDACEFASRLGLHIIYKNAAPVIVGPNFEVPMICYSGTPALSRAGSGDVLSGIIGAHFALKCSAFFAAARSYTILARAAWMAAQEIGEDAVLASDIIARIGLVGRI